MATSQPAAGGDMGRPPAFSKKRGICLLLKDPSVLCSAIGMCLALEMHVRALACLSHPVSSVCVVLLPQPEPINNGQEC